jgi:hypothetical protein
LETLVEFTLSWYHIHGLVLNSKDDYLILQVGFEYRVYLQGYRRQVSGDISLCSGTLPGRGIDPGAISIDTTAISIAVSDLHDEE